MTDARRYYITTYGCQMNVLDSELLASAFEAEGMSRAVTEEEAEVVVFNTCSVRDLSEQKAISRIGRLKTRAKHDRDMRVVVMGCMAQRAGEDLLRKNPHIDVIAGTRMFMRIPDLLREIDQQGGPIVATEEKEEVRVQRDPKQRENKWSAFVEVMRGCDHACAYCIVPTTRGKEVSRPIADLIDEVRRLVDDGVKEITFLGQNINSYGGRRPGDNRSGLGDLLYRASEVPGLARLKFITSHPKDFDHNTLDAMAERPNLAPFLHVPPQSGSDAVLKRMRRGYTANFYRDLVVRARERIPQMAFAGDFIVGFPGETDEDFAQSVQLLRDVKFQIAYLFKYSPRPGTKSSDWPDDIPLQVKKDRHAALTAAQLEVDAVRQQALVGSDIELLVEGTSKRDDTKWMGRTITGVIGVFPKQPGESDPTGELVTVRVTHTTPLTLFAAREPVPTQ
jgi:tRNA-2-methylthio-N6-dimethylallyladenosine synthase